MGRTAPRHGEGGASPSMPTSALNRAPVDVDHRRGGRGVRLDDGAVESVEVGEHVAHPPGRPAELPGKAGLAPALCVARRARGAETPAGNRLAVRAQERELGGARGRSAEAGRLGAPPPRRCAGRHCRRTYRPGGGDLSAGAGSAEKRLMSPGIGTPPIPGSRMRNRLAAGRGAPAPARVPAPSAAEGPAPAPVPSTVQGPARGARRVVCPGAALLPPGASGGGSGAGCKAPRPSRECGQSPSRRDPAGWRPKRGSAHDDYRAGAASPAGGRATAGRTATDTHRA